jgi:hypothetical protein
LVEFDDSLALPDVRLWVWIGFNLELRTFAAMRTMDVADTKKTKRSGCELVSVIGYGRIVESTWTNVR